MNEAKWLIIKTILFACIYLLLEQSWQFFTRFLCGVSVHLNFDRHMPVQV